MHRDDELLRRGREQHEAGNPRAAAELYQQALRANPRDAKALYLFGCLLHESGNSKAAEQALGRAADADPLNCEHHNALATVRFALGSHAEAERGFRRAIAMESRAHFHESLGLLLRKQGRDVEALAEFRTALDRDQANATALSAVRRSGDGKAQLTADSLLERAVAGFSTDAARLRAFAGELQGAEDLDGAAEVYRKALALDPASAGAWYELGCAETSREEYVPAAECFEKALQLQPDSFKARHNLARALCETGQVSEAIAHLRVCAASPDARVAAMSRGTLAVMMPGAMGADHQAVLDARRAWVRDLPAAPAVPRAKASQGPLRIGYVSSFFHRDNWMKPVWGLIDQHDRREVAVHLFSDAPRDQVPRAHPEDRFFDMSSWSNDELRAAIDAAGVQVLIDLNGYSEMARAQLFRSRLAPVAIGWFNAYATTALPGFDYLIGDGQVLALDEERFYTERIERVTGSYLTFAVDYPVPPVTQCSSAGFTFGSLCSQYKNTPEVIAAWSRILNGSPGSTLLLKNKHLRSPAAAAFVRGQFAARGVDAARLILEGPCGHYEFLETYGRIDLALDTFPYNGGTTTTEAIWQGVPVLTFAGDRWASRTSASILRAAGLGGFVADDLEGFVALGIRLAGARDELAAGRADMRAQVSASAACDTAGFAREMEQIYKKCWRLSHAG